MSKTAPDKTPHPPPQGPPTEDLEAVLEEMEHLQADLSRKKPPTPPSPDFSPSPTIDPEDLLGPGIGKLAASVYYQLVGNVADRPTLQEYISEGTLALQGGLAEATFAKYFPGDDLQNHPEYILLVSVVVSTWMALNVAPTTAQIAARGGPPPPPAHVEVEHHEQE